MTSRSAATGRSFAERDFRAALENGILLCQPSDCTRKINNGGEEEEEQEEEEEEEEQEEEEEEQEEEEEEQEQEQEEEQAGY
ncbi:hypothetical protein CRUP_020996 [Coryphaenoides rupestris]|nr:hypothetical protein CRUP_020996 [Coryphaenoides rupestris]